MMSNLHCGHGVFAVLLIMESFFGFCLSDKKPVNFCPKDVISSHNCSSEIPVFVNRLTSTESVFPFEYEHFDFCKPKEDKSPPTENLGRVVFGDRIRSSPYEFTFGEDGCGTACEKKYKKDDKDDLNKIETLIQAIRLNYQHHWIIDDMPVSSCYITEDERYLGRSFCYPSFPVGCYVDKDLKGKDNCHFLLPRDSVKADTTYLFNHVELTIEFHKDYFKASTAAGASHLVKAQVSRLASIAHNDSANIELMIKENKPLALPENLSADFFINYTYRVTFKENVNVVWSSRWDYIFDSAAGNVSVAFFSIMNSIVIIFFLSGAIALILLRTICEDKVCLKMPETVKRIFCPRSSNDPRWKLVQGDVFRPPCGGMLLAVFLGSGVQICGTTVTMLGLASVGVLSPAKRGELTTCILIFFVSLGTAAGYACSMTYKTFGGEKWVLNAILTACVCPAIVFAVMFVLNVTYWSVGSSAAIPCLTLFYLVALWLGVSLPLMFLGAYFGFKSIEYPVLTDEAARPIPRQPLLRRPLVGIILGGILPFGCIFMQFFFILESIWSHQLYYMFGYLFLAFLLLVITSSEVTITLCYYHLCSEDYRWWWRSFLTSGFTAFYVFLYSIIFYITKLKLDGFLNAFVYFGYAIIITFIVFLCTGTIGFFACFWFVKKIYDAINVEKDVNTDDQLSEKIIMCVDEKKVPLTLEVSELKI